MKILHCADLHLGAYVGPQCDDPMKRMENTCKCLDVLAETARRERPDVILVAGDIFHTARVWSDRALVEVRLAADYLNELSEYAPVVVLYGTPNHDGEQQFEALKQMTGIDVYYITKPEILKIPASGGIFNNNEYIQIAGLPGFDKGHFRAQFPGLSAEEENKVFTEQLAGIVAGLSAQVDPSIPSVLMAHHTVVGCELDNGQHVFQSNEVVLPAAALDASAFDLVCLGHIHKAQRVEACRKPVYYAGSIDAFTFNDEGHDKGFWIHCINENSTGEEKYLHFGQGYTVGSTFTETPAREFYTIKWNQADIQYCLKYGWMYEEQRDLEDMVVRILYTCDSETEKALNKKKLEQDLYAAGAYYVSEIRPEKVTAAVNREGMTEKLTVSECLERYLKEKHGNFTKQDIVDISWLADSIIETVEASQPIGTTSGLFLPVEIEVHNYRSYAAEKFSFEDIFFAMVNGRNGSGKSSLFMDAITDCLYEETREKELTGWIRNGEKSGSIAFTFKLGADLWRVTRTRQRSGKATLALAKQEWHGGVDLSGEVGGGSFPIDSWQDHSAERLNDTQQKIVDLLGMDCDTFQSCVLIMQDRYGKFMEADKSERMAVLANLLGLGIYDDLLKLTKEKLTETNREVRSRKEEIQTLEGEVAGEDGLHTELQQAEVELRTAQDDLTEIKEWLNALHGKIGAIAGYEEEEGRLKKDLSNNTESYTAKKNRRDDLQRRVEETWSFLQNEKNILDKCAELDKAKLDIAALDGKVQLLEDKKARRFKLNQEMVETRKAQKDNADRLAGIRSRLEEADELEATVHYYTNIEEQLELCEKKAARHQEVKSQLESVNSNIHNHKAETARAIASYEDKLMWLENQAAMLDSSDCIDIVNAKCKFLKSAKEADISRKSIRKECEDYETERESGLGKLSAESERIAAEIVSVGYERDVHDTLTQAAKTYRTAKDQLAGLAADTATAEQLEQQDVTSRMRIEVITDELAELETDIFSLELETNSVDELKRRVAELARYEREKEQLPKAKQFIESTAESITQLNSDIEELSQQCKTINDRLNELTLLTVDKGSLYAKKRDIETRVLNLEAIISNLNQRIGTINADLKTIAIKKFRLSEKQGQLQELAKQAAQLQVLAEAFSQDGIPYQIIRDIVPELEAAANDILSQMTGGRMRLEFVTEKVLKSNKAKEVATLEIIISDVDNGVLPYLSRSGGQKVRAALAVNFALANIKASRVGLQLGMMFVDEPPFLDSDGVEAYCAALEIQHEKFPEMRIVAISHDENMKARFPQQIQIEVTENGSKVRRG